MTGIVLNPFLDWLTHTAKVGTLGIVLVEGSGPFDIEEFGLFLATLKIIPIEMALNPEITDQSQKFAPWDTLIIGTDDWNEETIQNLIISRAGNSLKIYSQEMFLAYIQSGKDPFDKSYGQYAELLEWFASGHPALEYLRDLDIGFDWPSTFVYGKGQADVDSTGWPKVGLLKKMGYKVGQSGINNNLQRQIILRKVFETPSEELPQVKSPAHMKEWGTAKSDARLKKMVNSIAYFCVLEKKRLGEHAPSVIHRESDLNWLKNNFYQGRFHFDWPSTFIQEY